MGAPSRLDGEVEVGGGGVGRSASRRRLMTEPQYDDRQQIALPPIESKQSSFDISQFQVTERPTII